jgi:ABC-type Fe3+/spermidine/putrescine transport system ATPase subunit
MALLEVSEIGRNEEGIEILKGISFTQQPLEKLGIAGATGTGKTTLLKIIAGLLQPNTGEVVFEGKKVKGPDEKLIAGHPQISYLSQHFELRNHYRVRELMEMAGRKQRDQVLPIAEVCRVEHLLERWTHQLSGGERQRVSFAIALTTDPKLLLLDEPYSNLDNIHRNILKAVIDDIGERLGVSCILISHDPTDLLSWADNIIVLNEGVIVQQGAPEQVYSEPGNEYTAALFGKYNVLDKELGKAFKLPANGSTYYRFIRPEAFSITVNGGGLRGEVKKVNYMGSYYELEVIIDKQKIIAFSYFPVEKGDVIYLSL